MPLYRQAAQDPFSLLVNISPAVQGPTPYISACSPFFTHSSGSVTVLVMTLAPLPLQTGRLQTPRCFAPRIGRHRLDKVPRDSYRVAWLVAELAVCRAQSRYRPGRAARAATDAYRLPPPTPP